MKNEIEKRRGGEVLYENVEPLFPDDFVMRRMRLRRLISAAFFVCILACAIIIGVSGKASEYDNGKGGEGLTLDDNTCVEGESESKPSNGFYESDPESAIEEGDSLNEMATEYTGEESDFEYVTESCTEKNENDVGGDIHVVGVDLSQIDKGENYVINYSDSEADIVGLLDRGFSGCEEVGGAAPLFLIIHTHTSEEYLEGDSGYRGPNSVVSVGDVLASRLNTLGVGAVHCTVIHDDGGDPYGRTEATIRTMLDIYPSIKYILDIHRLVLNSDGAEIKSVSGCADNSSQIRLSVGTHGAAAEWQENLSLALSLRSALNSGGRICMPVVISPSIPNSSLGTYYLTVDVGTSVNTVEEAMAAGRRLAVAIADVVLG